MNKKITIAVDGCSSSGKSTLAKGLASSLGYIYIDTGAMYRMVTLTAMRNNLINGDEVNCEKLREIMAKTEIGFSYNSDTQKSESMINGENAEELIRSLDVSDKVSYIAKIPFVRELLAKKQREMGKDGGVIMDGRDIGTVVFPDAELKLFITADAEIRALRRYKELTAKGDKVSLDEITENVKKRDYIDENREIAPLKRADDAVLIDTGNMTPDEQLAEVIKLVNSRL